jgi:hypothetical protein
MKVTGGMNYREWQRRNKEHFSWLTKVQQKQARHQGYCNLGWGRVQNSWQILCQLTDTDKVTSLFEHKFSKGDLVGAIDLLLLEAEQAKGIARKAVSDLDANEKRLSKIADEALAKYPLL